MRQVMADISPTGEAEATQRQLIEENKKVIEQLRSLSDQYQKAAAQQKLLLPKIILQGKALQSQIGSMRAQIANDAVTLKLTQDRIASAQAELDYRRRLQNTLGGELKQKEALLAQNQTNLSALKAAQDQANALKEAKDAELDQVLNNLSAKQTDKAAVESLLQNVQTQYANEINRRNEAGQGVTELEKQLGESIRNLGGTLEMYDVEIEAAKIEQKKLAGELTSLNRDIQSSEEYFEQLNQENKELTGEVAKLQTDIKENQVELRKLPEEIQQLTSEAGKLSDSMAAKENEITKLKLDFIAEKFTQVGEALIKLRDKLYEMQQELGTTLGTAINVGAAALTNRVTSFFSGGTILSFKDTVDTINAFQQEFGGLLTRGEAQKIAQESKTLGVSAQVFLRAQRSFLTAGADATKTSFITQFRAAGLTAAQALKFAADNANLVAIAGSKYADALARAAANAQRIGVGLDKTEALADGIVGDFEGALERFSELRAMGVEVDFNRLAAVAGTGTPEEVQQELSSQLGGNQNLLNELQRNRFLKVALEKDLGLNVADIQRLAAGPGAVAGEETKPEETQRTLLMKVGERLGTVATVIGGLVSIISALLIPTTLANTAATNANTVAMRGTAAGGLRSLFGLGPKAGPGGVPVATPPVAPTGGGLPTSGVQQASTGVSTFGGGAANMLKIGVAMVALASSVYILGKALMLFNDINWESMAKMGVTLTTLGVAIKFAGPSIAAGLAAFANPAVMAGVAILSLGLLSLGASLRLAAPAFDTFGKVITAVFSGVATIITTVSDAFTKLVTALSGIGAGQLAKVGLALIPFSIGLAALGNAALIAAPGLALLGGLSAIGAFIGSKLGFGSTPEGKAEGGIITGPGKASGGMITGPGTPTSDNILTPTSPGEYVVNAKATKAYGMDMLDNINKGTFKQPEAPPVNNVVNVNMDKMEAKLDKLAAAFSTMKIDIDGNTVGRVSLNSRSPLDRLSVVG